MRFLKRGGAGGGSADERVTAFWAWWAGPRDGLARDIESGAIAGRADDISEAVHRLEADLAWELAPGTTASHMLVVTPEGNPELRPMALRWLAAAPPADGKWEYPASRQPGELHTLGLGGLSVDLNGMRAVTSWDENRQRVSVRLWHQAFEGLPAGPRTQVAFLFLDNLLGEDDVERWIGKIDADPSAQAGRTPDELRAEVGRRADEARAAGDTWVVGRGTDEHGGPVIVRVNAALKRIDHPYESEHLVVTLDRGLQHAGDTDLNAAIAAAEDVLLDAMTGAAIEVAHVTDAKRRTTHFVCTPDGASRALAIANDWAARHRQWGAAAKVRRDPRWQFHRELGG